MPALVATTAVALLVHLGEPMFLCMEAGAGLGLVAVSRRASRRPRRIAVLGSSAAAEGLMADLRCRGRRPQMMGRIGAAPVGRPDRHWLGDVADLRAIVERYEIDLLLLCRGVPRMEVFEELDRSCWDLPVRLCELSWFYESEFKQVPIAELDAAWLQCLLHPRYDPRPPWTKRALDVVVSVIAAAIVMPLLLLLALLIRRDGGPALYRQVRIGEGGRPFTMLKLRTMHHVVDADSPWTLPDDVRVTRLGAVLRRAHIDELPQLLNVLRGQMSIVGPRPEQPLYVQELERSLRFYSRRHQLRPGLTGWAQVRCGYGGSQLGTAWKLSHDLYYLKHRGLRFDLLILLETLRTPFSSDQFAVPEWRPLVFGALIAEDGTDAPPLVTAEPRLAAAGSS
jgi:lipopolysaccharide/colanic/teichoic acid biosynthesis glycosyltransferase